MWKNISVYWYRCGLYVQCTCFQQLVCDSFAFSWLTFSWHPTFQSSLVLIEIITQRCNYRALNNGVLCILQVLLKFWPLKSALFLRAPQKNDVTLETLCFILHRVWGHHLLNSTTTIPLYKKTLENILSSLMMDLMECPPYQSSCFHPYLSEPFEDAFHTPSPVTSESVHLLNTFLVLCYS